MKKTLIVLGFILLILLNIAIYYVALPFIVVWVLGMLGFEVSFWVVFWIMFVLYILIGLLK